MRHGSQPTANRPPHLVASYDTQGGAEDVFYPDVPTGGHSASRGRKKISTKDIKANEFVAIMLNLMTVPLFCKEDSYFTCNLG